MQEARWRQIDLASVIVAGLLFVVVGVVLRDAFSQQLTSTYGVGPKAMAFVVAGGLAILAIGNLIIGLRSPAPEREDVNVTAIMRILGGLCALIAVIGFGGGFIVATTLLFAMTSSAFGRKAFHIDLLIGFVLATVVYIIFSKFLALSLPTGPLESLF